jgi:hypothetical protein
MHFPFQLIFLFLLMQVIQGCSQSPSAKAGIQGDIVFYNDYLATHHKNLFAKLSKEKFDSAVNALKKIADTLPAEKIIIELFKINALIADEHTKIEPQFTERFPLRFEYFDDAISIISADRQYEDLLSCKILFVNQYPINEVIKKLSTIFKSDNPSFTKFWLPVYMNKPSILKGLDLIADTKKVKLTFITASGDTLTRTITAFNETRKTDFIKADPQKIILPYTKDDFYWYKYDSMSNTIYFNYNKCQNADSLSFKKFNSQLFEEIKQRNPAKLIVDLRYNGGGNSSVFNPFLSSIKDSYLNAKGKLFVLIGRKTFSSAIMNAIDLVRETNAITVGEPTGGNINHYGEIKSFQLPFSKINISYSTKYWENWSGHNGALIPDINAAHSLINFISNKDEAIEYILKQ